MAVLAIVVLGNWLNVKYIQSVANQPVKSALGNADLNRYIKAPTNTAVTCGTGSTLAAATSTARQYLALVNDSANTIYLGLGVAAVSGSGIRLNAGGGAYEMGVDTLFTGAVYCIASSGSAMTVLEANTQ